MQTLAFMQASGLIASCLLVSSFLSACSGEPSGPAGPFPDAGAGADSSMSRDGSMEDDASRPDGGDSGADDGLTDSERASLADELERASGFADTVSAMAHYNLGRQASTYFSGPVSADPEVQVRFFADIGVNPGASPWHVISPRTYGVGAHTLWGVGLTDAYKVSLDDEFAIVDTFSINRLPTSILWNLVALDDGRVIVPDQNGFNGPDSAGCRTTNPTLIVLNDAADDLSSDIECQQVFELEEADVRAACGVSDGTFDATFSGTDQTPLFTGELAVRATFADAGGERTSYLAVVDRALSRIVACEAVGSLITNAVAGEREGPTVTALYAVTEDRAVKITYDAATETLSRGFNREVPVRFRTGTTPTLVNASSGERFLVFVDARCAVGSVLNGLILCSEDTGASRLIAVRRENNLGGAAPVVTAELPDFVDTVENSPAARGDMVVVANYSGYLPNGLRVPPGGFQPEGDPNEFLVSPDAVAEFATGLVALRWSAASEAFEVAWEVRDRQANGVPAISGGANRVYVSGAEEESAKTYLYAFRLQDDAQGAGGEEVMRVEIADAPFRTPSTDADGNLVFTIADLRFREGELFDQGNNLIIHSDRSIILSGGAGLARVRDR